MYIMCVIFVQRFEMQGISIIIINQIQKQPPFLMVNRESCYLFQQNTDEILSIYTSYTEALSLAIWHTSDQHLWNLVLQFLWGFNNYQLIWIIKLKQ